MSTARHPGEASLRPWHQACTLREDIRTGSLDLAEFAADLQSVRTGTAAEVYARPERFFPRTFPTYNLRTVVRDVLLRLAGREGRPVIRLQVAYGGGKTHALLTLLHLAEHGHEFSADPTVRQFLDFAGLAEAPAARVAVLPFDQFDVHHGLRAFAPDGRGTRQCLTPWGALAYQLGGDAGFARVAQHEADYISPAEPVLTELLALPAAQGLSTLVLVDEAVWYGNEAAKQDRRRLGVLRDFFQVLTQAVSRQPRSALVATLISSDVHAHDSDALAVLQVFESVFGRLTATAEPVVREDVAEILRRRLFESVAAEPVRRAATDAVFARLQDLPVREAQKRQPAYDRMLASYPFHADLIDALYQKWSQLPGAGFQRTRGALRLMAYALKEAEPRDTGVWVGPGALLGVGPAMSPALTELSTMTADRDRWAPILVGELGRAVEIQAEHPTLRAREVEQAVVATFLHSQPEGQSAAPADLWALLAHPQLDRAALEEGLRLWRHRSWFLTEDEAVWRLGTAPNLTAMHLRAMERVAPSAVEAQVRRQVEAEGALSGADSGVTPHVLPESPADIKPDAPLLRYLILGPECATSAGTEPPPEVAAFWTEVSPGNPRTYRNGLLALAPDPARLAGLQQQARGVLAWKALREADDFVRVATDAQKAQARKNSEQAEQDLPGAILACYNVALAQNTAGRVTAQALPGGTARPFDRLKALLQSEDRLIVGEIEARELLPESDLQLWSSDEQAQPVAALVAAFYQFRRLPPLLRPELLHASVRAGVRDGVFCLRVRRPDGTAEIMWRAEPSDDQLRRPEAEVVVLAHAALERVRPELLLPRALPGLWSGAQGPAVSAVLAYFDGRQAPRLASPAVLQAALRTAVREGLVALEAGGRTYLGEDIPEWPVLSDAVLAVAAEPLTAESLLPAAVPAGWPAGAVTDLATLAAAIAAARGAAVPWSLVVRAVEHAVHQSLVQLEPGTGAFPCPFDAARTVHIGLPLTTIIAPGELVGTSVQGAWRAGRATVAALKEALEGGRRRIPSDVLQAAVQGGLQQGLMVLAAGSSLPERPGPETLAVTLQLQPRVHAVDGALTAKELQVLARVWPDLQRAAPQATLECTCTVTIRGDIPAQATQRLDALLNQVRGTWHLRKDP